MTHKLRMFLLALSFFALLGGLSGCGERAEQPVAREAPAQPAQAPVAEAAPTVAENPFFEAWDTPYSIPPFDRIRDNPEPPTFENTVEALELAGGSLRRVSDTFGNITNTDTNDFLNELEVEINPILTREREKGDGEKGDGVN